MASFVERGIAMRIEDMRADEVAERRAHEYVGRPMVMPEKPSANHRGCRAICQNLDPGFGILMSDYGSHRHGKHGMTCGKGSVYGVVLPEISMVVALPGALASCDDLHRRIYQ